jgi:hypothetical protein
MGSARATDPALRTGYFRGRPVSRRQPRLHDGIRLAAGVAEFQRERSGGVLICNRRDKFIFIPGSARNDLTGWT